MALPGEASCPRGREERRGRGCAPARTSCRKLYTARTWTDGLTGRFHLDFDLGGALGALLGRRARHGDRVVAQGSILRGLDRDRYVLVTGLDRRVCRGNLHPLRGATEVQFHVL